MGTMVMGDGGGVLRERESSRVLSGASEWGEENNSQLLKDQQRWFLREPSLFV
ncbi:hypothetical protein SESBI_10811 [Sesbania bispinosa]|nr:hypothetical protein SESBI_10811 [Sesbania bispinosa]